MFEIGLGHYLSLGAIIFFFRSNRYLFKQKKRHCNINVHRTYIISS